MKNPTLISLRNVFWKRKQYQQVKKMRWRESQVSVGRGGGWSGRSLTTAAASGASQRRRQGEDFASLSGNGDAAPNQTYTIELPLTRRDARVPRAESPLRRRAHQIALPPSNSHPSPLPPAKTSSHIHIASSPCHKAEPSLAHHTCVALPCHRDRSST